MSTVYKLKSHTSMRRDPTAQEDVPVPRGVTLHVPTLRSASNSVANQRVMI